MSFINSWSVQLISLLILLKAVFSGLTPSCPPVNLAYGRVYYNNEKKTVSFSCYPGFRMMGTATIRCREGVWDKLPPICFNTGKVHGRCAINPINEEREKRVKKSSKRTPFPELPGYIQNPSNWSLFLLSFTKVSWKRTAEKNYHHTCVKLLVRWKLKGAKSARSLKHYILKSSVYYLRVCVAISSQGESLKAFGNFFSL